ncbi:MAG: BMP family ABC transporter substrate-binding protein [Actinomycetota bacterium]
MAQKRWRLAIALMLVLGLFAAACGGGDDETTDAGGDETTTTAGDAAEPAEEFKIAFVHVGPTADKGWSWAHNEGAKYLEANMPGVKITTLESIDEGPDSQRVFEDLAADGNMLIFGTSFGYMDPMLAAAENFPDVAFVHATGYKTGPNMGNYFGAAEEGRYLSGMAAGDRTESNLIGYVAAFGIPEVVRGINAFTLGVREVNPDAEVQVVWTSTWFDPPTEGDAAQALLDAGADVIAMHQDSSAPGQKAEAAGAGWVGYNTDMTEFAPNAWLTAAIWDWGPFYLKTAQEVAAGTWEASAYYGNMNDGMVDIAPFGPSVSDEMKSLIETRKQEIVDGSFSVFSDPIVGQDGAERELGDIFSMNYFVEGVIGEVPTG